MKSIHKINLNSDDESPLKKQRSLENFIIIQRKSIEEEISRLASVDGLSFNCIANSKFIQESLKSQ